MPPIGRRPGSADTRAILLDTARKLFADNGYDRTSVRDIATAAGVDPALIRHYFGNKDGLFRATMGWPFDPAELAARIVDGDLEGIGERLARVFLALWDQPESRGRLEAILRGAATHEESATLARQFIQDQLYQLVAAALPGPDPELRIDLAMAQLLGIAYLRYILRVEPIASESIDNLATRVAPTITSHLIG
ncbi:TetR/AcrR family transcriptional regulator [Nocardia stercoris]|uniref:TetR/AcrR family transcriptional regulator n=1 Tax=Nocardia stercoris TaxID=2483361 RepID=A0A3M2L155_9NOCA|nr:TetR family transcriptional regulator [Nocardia stercoris]RMI31377.1 TetR/AcrR family transcriptional regulator [Nocardia stercoris]